MACATPGGLTSLWCSADGFLVKVCSHCLEEKPLADFYGPNDGRYDSWCKECRKADSKARWITEEGPARDKQLDQLWARKLWRHFKLTPEDYARMLAEQDGKCLICSRTLAEIASVRFRHFSVDHDRACCPGSVSCGKCIRGLLCAKCNGSLGWYEQFATEIVAYLGRERAAV